MSSLLSIICMWLLLQISADQRDMPVQFVGKLYDIHNIDDDMSIAYWLVQDKPELDKEFDQLYDSLYAFVDDFVQRVITEDDIRPFLDSYDLNHNDTGPTYTVAASTCNGKSCLGCAKEGQV